MLVTGNSISRICGTRGSGGGFFRDCLCRNAWRDQATPTVASVNFWLLRGVRKIGSEVLPVLGCFFGDGCVGRWIDRENLKSDLKIRIIEKLIIGTNGIEIEFVSHCDDIQNFIIVCLNFVKKDCEWI
jgi:hypothetical protein